MADAVHIQKLCEGPVTWNAWREANPTVLPDLANASLSLSQRQWGPSNGGPINLSGANLEGSMLRFATLTDANLENARLVGTDLMHARLDRTNLRGADLTDAMLDHTDLTGTRFDGATLVGASLQNARNLRQPQVDGAHGDASTLLPHGLIAPQHWFPATSPEEFLGCPIPEEVIEEETDNNPFRLLGVKPNADPTEIREAYRKLVKQLHPDLNPGNREAEKKFRKINEAYNLLKSSHGAIEDARKRARMQSKPNPARGRYEVAALFALFLAIGGGVFYWLETMPEESQVASVQEEAPKLVPKPENTITESIHPANDKKDAPVTSIERTPLKPVGELPHTPTEAQAQPLPHKEDLLQTGPVPTEPPAQDEPRVLVQNEAQPHNAEPQASNEAVTPPAVADNMAPTEHIAPTSSTQAENNQPPTAKAGGQLLSARAQPDQVSTSSSMPTGTMPVKVAAWEEEWHRLHDTRDFAAVYGYVRRHPGEPAAAEARARFRALIASLNTTVELAGFVKKHEGHENSELAAARQRLASLTKNDALKVETMAWEGALKKNTRAAYDGYLRAYSNGAHAAEANEKIAALREAYRKRDDTAWAKASLENTREAYSAYLAAHPRGYHLKDAQNKLAAIPQPRPAAKPKPSVPRISFD